MMSPLPRCRWSSAVMLEGTGPKCIDLAAVLPVNAPVARRTQARGYRLGCTYPSDQTTFRRLHLIALSVRPCANSPALMVLISMNLNICSLMICTFLPI